MNHKKGFEKFYFELPYILLNTSLCMAFVPDIGDYGLSKTRFWDDYFQIQKI